MSRGRLRAPARAERRREGVCGPRERPAARPAELPADDRGRRRARVRDDPVLFGADVLDVGPASF